jgi:hypothetical protein
LRALSVFDNQNAQNFCGGERADKSAFQLSDSGEAIVSFAGRGARVSRLIYFPY